MSISVARRLALTGLTLIGVSLLVFLVARPTEDIVNRSLGSQASAEQRERLADEWGLDRPVAVQYVEWLSRTLQGDFGTSLAVQQLAIDLITDRIPYTLELVAAALPMILIVGAILVVAQRAGNLGTGLSRIVEAVSAAAPAFWLGLMLILIFGVNLGVLPLAGRCPAPGCTSVSERLERLLLPALTLSAAWIAQYALWSRGARTRHKDDASPSDPARLSAEVGFTFFGVALVGLLTNLVAVETIFSWPGIGRLGFSAFVARDYTVLMGVVIVLSVGAVVGAFVLDVVAGALSARSGAGAQRAPSYRTPRQERRRQPAAPTGHLTPAVQAALAQLRPDPPMDLTWSAEAQVARINTALSLLQGEPYTERPRPHLVPRRRPKPGGRQVLAMGLLLLIVLMATLAPWINDAVLHQDPLAVSIEDVALPIGSAGHPLGTDELGRDVLARLLVAGRTTLGIALLALVIAAGVGALLGVAAGHMGGAVDAVVRWLIFLFMSVPLIPVLLLAVAAHGSGFTELGVMLGLVGWTNIALRAREQTSAGDTWDVRWVATAALTLGVLVLLESTMSFLGAGVPPPSPSLGGMLARGWAQLIRSPHLVVLPGLAITLIVVCLFALRDWS